MNPYVNTPNFNSFPGLNTINSIPGHIPSFSHPFSNLGHTTPWTGYTPSIGGLPFGGFPGSNPVSPMPFGYNAPFFGGSLYNGLGAIGTFPGLWNGQTTGSFVSTPGFTPWSNTWNVPFNGLFNSPISTIPGMNYNTPWNVPFGTIPFNTLGSHFGGFFPYANGLTNYPGLPTGGFNWNSPIGGQFPFTGVNTLNNTTLGHNVPGYLPNVPFGVSPAMYGGFPTPFIGQPWGYMPGFTPMNTATNGQPNTHGSVPFQSNQGLCREAA